MNDLHDLIRRPLRAVAVFSFFLNLLLLVPALFMLQVFDRVLASGSRETLLMLLLGAGIALVLMLLLDNLRSRLQAVIGQIVGDSLLPEVARRMLAQAARRVERAPGEGLRDVATLRSLFSTQGLLALFDAPWIVVYVAVIWLAHPVLGLAAAFAAALMVTLAIVTDRLTRKGLEEVQREGNRTARYLESSMHNAEVVETLGMAGALLARWRQLNARVAGLQRTATRRSVAMAAGARTLRQAVQVLMLATGAYLVITQAATAGVMVATTILLGRALAPVEQIVASWKLLAEARAAYGRLRALLAGEAAPERMALPAPRGVLDAAGVVLRAPGSEKLILAGVSFHLNTGEALAVIGASGAGKSSLMRVLAGIWPPAAGSVRLDGADLTQLPRESIGPHIGYVPQDVELFSGTVAENIARLGRVDEAKVVEAAMAAGVHEMILALPEGYDTRIEQMGAMLSPGQRQRLALARALYGDPRLLLLDEPNSNLDGAGEAALGEALRRLRGKVTVVMVTHRTSLIQHADRMLVLDGGRVKHFGTAAEVMRAMQAPTEKGRAQVVSMPRAVAARDASVAGAQA